MISTNEANQLEWARMAGDAYRCGRNEWGHRYSAAAAMPQGTQLRDDVYDSLMRPYRSWLIGGWAEVDSPDGVRSERSH